MNKRLLLPLGGFAAAVLGFTALLYACAAWFRPDVSTLPAPPPEAELKKVQAARKNAEVLDTAHPTVLTREVNYGNAARSAWWPKGEAPVLSELVKEGRLPSVAERTGSEPLVMEGVDGIGRYGGTWYRLVNANFDFGTIYWRLSAANLVRWSPQGYPLVPHIAKSWEISPDYRVYTFTLRRGMRWSDGQPFTSEDISYWYEHEVKYFNIQPPFLRAGSTLGRVETPDERHVRFVFSEPNPLFLERLASTGQNYDDYTEYIVPAHYLRQYHPALGNQELIRKTMESLKLSSPVALYKRMKHYLNPEHPRLWPWIYHTYQPTTPQTFVRNPYYFVVDSRGNQLPYLDRLVLDIKSANLIAVSASNGEPSMQDRHIRYEDQILLLESAARNGYEVYHWKPSSQSAFTIFPNLNRQVDPARPETKWKHALLNESRFRQALSLAINRRDIIDAEFNGQTVPAQIDPGMDSPYHNEHLFNAFTRYDPARANALLDEIGLTRRDAEGYRTFPDGTRMTFILNLTDFTPVSPAQFIVDDWARVGVRLIPHLRARKLFDQEKLAYEHDFTVWTGESEFYPLVEPRNFVPTYGEAYYAPGFGEWYRNGGLYGDPAARRPNAVEPPPGHPLRRAMEILQEVNTLPGEAARRARFDDVLEIAAQNLWSISISTAPPQLVVVKNGFRNVPRTALFGGKYQTPGNTGIETYFWDQPAEDPAVVEQTKREIATITPPPNTVAADGDTADASEGESTGRVIRILLLVALAAGLVLAGLRHPFIGRRLLLMIPTMFVVSVIVFALVQLPPGDFADTRIAQLEMQGTSGNDQLAADLRKNFHLDEPIAKQYARWVGLVWFTSFRASDTGLLQGNLGLSMEHEKPVNEVIGDRIGLTVLVSIATVLFTWAIALPTGIYSAVRQYSAGDYALTLLGFLGMSVPSFLLALVLMYLAKRWFGVNIDGLFSPEFATMPGWSWAKAADLMKHLWLPVIVLGFGGTAGMIRVMRANLLDELKKPYVTTARAKGVRPLKLLLKYPVRLALNPFVSGLGGLFPQLVSGGAIVAMVLSLPMVGPTMLDALLVEDIYLAGSMLMVLSLLGVVGTLVSDLLLLWLDPRIRLGERAG
ncbi:MAG TPA: ABC transporter substrate-binding protein [Opitutaceae bacterium]|nr:ABC transporter substrate-binding protein [Opitutaceae bacterium]